MVVVERDMEAGERAAALLAGRRTWYTMPDESTNTAIRMIGMTYRYVSHHTMVKCELVNMRKFQVLMRL